MCWSAAADGNDAELTFEFQINIFCVSFIRE